MSEEQTTETVEEIASTNGQPPDFTPPDLLQDEWKIVRALLEKAHEPTGQGKLIIGALQVKVEQALG